MQISILVISTFQRDRIIEMILLSIINIYLAPLQKLISTQSLAYLPNLYFRKYKLIESLNHTRFDFPQQKVLVSRQMTSWDAVLCQMKQKAEFRKQFKKFKIAQNYHVAKTSKQQVVKKQLKKEEKSLFHRITANHLAENIRNFFLQNSSKPSKSFSNNNSNIINGNSSSNQAIINGNNEFRKNNLHDDIFIDNKDSFPEDQFINQHDILDDILNQNPIQKAPSYVYKAEQPKRNIKNYVTDYMKLEDGFNDQEPSQISRKACLKRINQNLRKRLKNKDEQDRSLTSATVALSNLINNQPQSKNTQNMIQVPNQTEWMFEESIRVRRKKDDQIELRWDQQQLLRMKAMNQKFDLFKTKQIPTALQLFATKQEYAKLFEKNISNNPQFPNSFNSVRHLNKKISDTKFYYNQFPDKQYETFIRKNNKRKLLQRFEKDSEYIFAEHYVHDQIQQNQKITMGRIFLYPPNKISDRIIFKITPGSSKLAIVAKSYNKKALPICRDKIILLSFLVKKYLAQFGNNWKTITQFIEIFPCFSNYLITPQLIQEFYQLVNRHQLKQEYLQNLQTWGKKLLPSNHIYNQSYKEYTKQMDKQWHIMEEEQTEDSYNCVQVPQVDVNISDYEKLINEPLLEKQNKNFKKFSEDYCHYAQDLRTQHTIECQTTKNNKILKIQKIIDQYKNATHVHKLQSKQKIQNSQWAFKYIGQNLKGGQIKSGIPFRKKKNINQRNNQLVKILQALRSKNSVMSSKNPQQVQKPPVSSTAPVPSVNVKPLTQPSSVIAPSSIPKPPTVQPTAAEKDGQKQKNPQLRKAKTPQKKVGGSQGTKKRKDKQEEKDKQKK